MKTEVQLKMAGVPYRRERGAPQASPKSKIPFIDDDGVRIADSTFIRWHLETAHGADFDRGLSVEQKAQAWAVERLLEDHLYWALLGARWMDDENFAKGPAHFFDGAPAAVRDDARARVKAALHAHGLGRHAPDEIAALAAQSLASLSAILGDKPCLMGPRPCGADATAFAMVAGILTPYFSSPLRDAARAHGNLIAYSERLMQRFYPAFEARDAA